MKKKMFSETLTLQIKMVRDSEKKGQRKET